MFRIVFWVSHQVMCFCCLHHHPMQLFESYSLVITKACTIRHNTELLYNSVYLWHKCLSTRTLKKYCSPKKKKQCVCLDRILLGSSFNVGRSDQLSSASWSILKIPAAQVFGLVTNVRGSSNCTCCSPLLVLTPQVLKENGEYFYSGSVALAQRGRGGDSSCLSLQLEFLLRILY